MTSRYALFLAGVAISAGMIAIIQRWLGIAPLILLVVPIAMSIRFGGIGATILSVSSAALLGDYLFVEPLYDVTVHRQGLRLFCSLALGAGSCALLVRWTSLRTTGAHKS